MHLKCNFSNQFWFFLCILCACANINNQTQTLHLTFVSKNCGNKFFSNVRIVWFAIASDAVDIDASIPICGDCNSCLESTNLLTTASLSKTVAVDASGVSSAITLFWKKTTNACNSFKRVQTQVTKYKLFAALFLADIVRVRLRLKWHAHGWKT